MIRTTRGRQPARQWRLGLIGAGRFGSFVLESLEGWDRLRPVAVADHSAAQAEAAAARFGLHAYAEPEALLARPEVDVVLISTLPASHYALARQALEAGKHVVCEKPLALAVDQADELIALAQQRGRLLAVNHMLRYSALLEAADRIVKSGLLGEVLHFSFENYAEDERLPAAHWFWDPTQSGGIFIEHAVHFFDLHRWWLGPGEVLAAHRQRRPGTDLTDRAWCELRHGDVLGHQYHGFDQPQRLDRADHRLLFARGDLTVLGWIPRELRVHGIVDAVQQSELLALCGECGLDVLEQYDGPRQRCRGRGHDYCVTARIALNRRLPEPKAEVYAAMIEALFADQLDVLDHPGHVPRLRAEEAREALAMAVQATRLAGARE